MHDGDDGNELYPCGSDHSSVTSFHIHSSSIVDVSAKSLRDVNTKLSQTMPIEIFITIDEGESGTSASSRSLQSLMVNCGCFGWPSHLLVIIVICRLVRMYIMNSLILSMPGCVARIRIVISHHQVVVS